MWCAIRTTYYESNITGLVVDCLRPLTEILRTRFSPARMLMWSHWKRGLHVNLACRIKPREQNAFEHYCTAHISNWLAERPSTSSLNHAAYIEASRRLGRLEGDRGPFEPLRQNNNVETWRYRTRKIGGSRARGILWERFLSESMETIFELSTLRRENAASFYAALTLLFATIGAFGGGLAHGHLSFRGHAEGLLTTSPQVSAVFERADRALGPLVAHNLSAFLSPGYTPPHWLASWQIALRALHDEIGAEEREESATERDTGAPLMLGSSRLAVAMQSASARALFASVTHKQYRTLVNFFYRILPTMGLSPLERARFAYVFAVQCKTVLQVDWESIFYQDQA